MNVASFAKHVVKIKFKKRLSVILFCFLVEAHLANASPNVNDKYSKVDLYLDLGQPKSRIINAQF